VSLKESHEFLEEYFVVFTLKEDFSLSAGKYAKKIKRHQMTFCFLKFEFFVL